MKKILLICLLNISIKATSQDLIAIRKIDSLITIINKSELKIITDSIIRNYPEYGLKMKTYLLACSNSTELKKYTNLVNTDRTENGINKKMITSNSFYYDKNVLIKVEEFAIEGDAKVYFDWYYSEGKSLYYTLKSDKAATRADFLLKMSMDILKQIQK